MVVNESTNKVEMTKREKIKYLESVLKSLSDSSARKLTYNLEEVARALYMKFSTGVAWEKIPLCRKYKRSTAYQYWWKKLKESKK